MYIYNQEAEFSLNKTLCGLTVITVALLACVIPNFAAAEEQIQASFFPYYEFTENLDVLEVALDCN